MSKKIEPRELLRRVYLWMTLGLITTTITSFIAVRTSLALYLLQAPFIVFILFIAQLFMVYRVASRVQDIESGSAVSLFLGYAALNGVTLSFIFFYYDIGTLTTAFAATVGLFFVMTLVGMFTKVDLTKMGSYAFIGLIGILFAMLLNFFLRSPQVDYVISVIGVLIFTGLTAYDTQKILKLAENPQLTKGDKDKVMSSLSILGALTLYLDFINMFLFFLRVIAGGRR